MNIKVDMQKHITGRVACTQALLALVINLIQVF